MGGLSGQGGIFIPEIWCHAYGLSRAGKGPHTSIIYASGYPSGNASSGRPDESDGSDGDVALDEVIEQRSRLAPPRKFAVLLHNDDYTTMEFVVEVLQRYFQRTVEQSVEIMLRVHKQGKGVAGVFSYEIAETKAAQVMEHAKTRGYPLQCTVEPE